MIYKVTLGKEIGDINSRKTAEMTTLWLKYCELEQHSVEHIYPRQRCSHGSQ